MNSTNTTVCEVIQPNGDVSGKGVSKFVTVSLGGLIVGIGTLTN